MSETLIRKIAYKLELRYGIVLSNPSNSEIAAYVSTCDLASDLLGVTYTELTAIVRETVESGRSVFPALQALLAATV